MNRLMLWITVHAVFLAALVVRDVFRGVAGV